MKARTLAWGALAACLMMVISCEALVAKKVGDNMAQRQNQKLFKEVCSNEPSVTISYNGQFMAQITSQSVGVCWIEGKESAKKELYCGTTQTGFVSVQLPQDAIFLGKARDGRESASTGPSNYICENAASKFRKENVYYVNFPR